MTSKQTQSIIIGLKGNNQSSITKKTTRLVTGHFPIDLIKDYHPLQKLLEAVQSGQQIKIISEKEFSEFLAQTFQLHSK